MQSSDISFKGCFALSTASLTTFKNNSIDLSLNDLVIVTAAGTIYGTHVLLSDEDDGQNDIGCQLMKSIASNVLEVCNEPSKFILLKDVTLISTNGFKQFFKYLHVFTDDIIAITFADITGNI